MAKRVKDHHSLMIGLRLRDLRRLLHFRTQQWPQLDHRDIVREMLHHAACAAMSPAPTGDRACAVPKRRVRGRRFRALR